jgi:hypothetical protein
VIILPYADPEKQKKAKREWAKKQRQERKAKKIIKGILELINQKKFLEKLLKEVNNIFNENWEKLQDTELSPELYFYLKNLKEQQNK